MQSTFRTVVFSASAATLCALAATLAVLAVSRPPSILFTSPSATSTTSSFDPGTTLDVLVQDGGATQSSVGFTLADRKAAQADARALAIADARTRAQAMAGAAGVKLGKVLRVSALSASGYASGNFDIKGGAAASTQVPVGQLDVQVAVEGDFAIDG